MTIHNDDDLLRKQFNQQHFSESKFTSIKELVLGKDNKIQGYIKEVQQGIINFCIHSNDLQSEGNYFKLKLNHQFVFNECVDKSINKVKNDFEDIEKTYLNCRADCFEKFPNSIENLNEYIFAKNFFSRPTLHPCIKECVSMYNNLHNNYLNYVFRNNGIYIEFADYRTWPDLLN